MTPRRPVRSAAVVAAFAAFVCSLATPASAQLFWDWGGAEEHGASGREIVRFSPQFGPGEIVVSFGDRRLYYVSRPGEAISYPIAIPRDEDRWEGVTSVSDKKVNPGWRPTPAIDRKSTRLNS